MPEFDHRNASIQSTAVKTGCRPMVATAPTNPKYRQDPIQVLRQQASDLLHDWYYCRIPTCTPFKCNETTAVGRCSEDADL